MIAAVVDTTVIIHLFRRHPSALAWYSTLSQPLGITPITWMETISGAGSRTKQSICTMLLSEFTLLYLSNIDQDWAMQQLERYRLSHGVTINDCLIAAVAHRLQVRLYTHNLRDMECLLGQLAVKPYP